LALVGAWRSRSHSGLILVIAYLAIRTALLTQLQTVEPRYLIVCFPLVLALGALAWPGYRQHGAAEEKIPPFLPVISSLPMSQTLLRNDRGTEANVESPGHET
jgi:hypothetical protein